ncbi:pilus assembly protein [Bradyrhizobium sp. 180]|nr:pilus assembly protein [Bradyrhizobium sp. CW12]MCK1489432.1 pilus assembly protein [Bradyrhizobium sp. 180]MCK1526714.1 pilus assembly protein [Bradyrhizobium sp. 182]MCK1599647.1 pilus assembly protein [Bradyrhizobium sp. 164]MCK1615378.1 pilus assembly protein [Bradyrhizobium sp. 159]MCK1647659.1 pilus assembly protein [Bradyrhizobium sp. 154]MCK1667527.1 pilus assembly protein [Bradyrhizobium sp. 153]MCK1755518.1 pilus assembly protein [Bradyrhizobium sp. 137]
MRAAVSDKRGVAAAEFGILIPVLSLMVVSVTDIGLALYRKMQVENAAQAGAQYAIARGFNASGISNAVRSATSATDITASPPPVQFCGCPTSAGVSTVTCGTVCTGGAQAGTYTTVSARATYYTIIDYQIVAATYTYSAQSTARLQ